MKFKKNLKIYITIITLLTYASINKIKALEVTQYTNGESTKINLPDCFAGSGQSCGGLTSDFVVRATIVDENREIVPGTEPIELYPQNPYNFEAYSWDGPSTPTWWSPDSNVHWGGHQDDYFGSSTVARESGISAEDWNTDKDVQKYRIYMGFGWMMSEPHWETFENYSDLRNGFINYASNLQDCQIHGDGPGDEIDGRVNFVEFVFKKTRFTDNVLGIHNTAKYNYEARKRMDELRKTGKHYYIILEPVYTFMMEEAYTGTTHNFRGTAKELANFAYNTAESSGINYWPIGHYEYMYNLYCNFLDESGVFGLSRDHAWRCDSPDRFQNITYVVEEINEEKQNAYDSCSRGFWNYSGKKRQEKIEACQRGVLNNKQYDFMKEYRTSAAFDVNFVKNIYSELKDPNTAYGVNILNLDELLDIPEVKNNECTYEINSCVGNDFEYSAKLTAKGESIYDCIYPSDNNRMSRDQLYQFSTRYDYLDLWCYDDVNYSFKNLQQINNINNTPFKGGQLLLVPSGKLTVNRTCFTKRDITETTDLSPVFEIDDANYQSEFTLNLNNKIYTYKRGIKYQSPEQSTNGNKKTSKFNYTITHVEANNDEKYTKISSQFTYDYNIQTGVEYNDKLSIGIKNYDIKYGSLFNSILYQPNFDGNGNVISLEQTPMGKYINILSTSSSKDEFSSKLNNGYGLSNNFYNNIINENKNVSDESGKTKTTSTKSVKHEEDKYIFENIYSIQETTSNYCNFETEVVKPPLFNEGVQFRVISLNHPFPARDGTSRLAGKNWLNKEENNVYEYIQKNRNTNTEEVYQKEPLYTVTLDTASMIKIREYNKSHSYSDPDITCEEGTGRKCISNFLRNTTNNYINKLEGTCANVDSNNISGFYTCADKTEKSGG